MTQNFAISPRILILAIALLFSLSATALSQEITGNIVGTVKDSSGAAVKGATVTITDDDKGLVVRTITTGDEGEFSAPQLPSANYSLTVEAPGFKKSLQTGLKLDVNQRRAVDVVLEAGNIAEVVPVAADSVAV